VDDHELIANPSRSLLLPAAAPRLLGAGGVLDWSGCLHVASLMFGNGRLGGRAVRRPGKARQGRAMLRPGGAPR